jgi:hypothetical protein
VPDKGFTPFFWKRKGDDASNDGPGKYNDGNDAPTRDLLSMSSSMDVDNKPQGGQFTPIGKSVPIGLGDGVIAPCVFAVTPINPNPKTPRG